MDIDSFFLSGHAMADSILGTVTMAVAGQSFQVVIDDVTKQTTGEDIGLMGEFALVAMAQAAAVTNPKALNNKRCTVDGSPYRISAVRAGSVAVSFTLQDPAQS